MDYKNNLEDVIAAISTPIGVGGIGIIRMSGFGCIDIADTIFKSKNKIKLSSKKSHTITFGYIIESNAQNIIDEVLVSIMKAPNTYTKEDTVEINCHGGLLVVKKILELLLNSGARLAEPGEFTKRAFLNGRIDLTQAEAVIDLIDAKTDTSHKMSINQLGGKLKEKIDTIRQTVLDIIAGIEAVIDYPEYDVEEETNQVMYQKLNYLKNEIKYLLDSSERGKILNQGIETVILGKPNVGKSSLLNYFLQEERAIVTNVPGTTRDTVEEMIQLDGIGLKIIDTAGIRRTEDIVEKIGVEKSKEYAKSADLVLFVLDVSKDLEQEDSEILELIQNKNYIVILNKSDLQSKIEKSTFFDFIEANRIISISIKENTGMQKLTDKIKELFFDGEINSSDNILIYNIRHKNALYYALESLKKAMSAMQNKMPEDFISIDLQEVNRYLAEITGDSIDDEIIDRIFTRFCLGK